MRVWGAWVGKERGREVGMMRDVTLINWVHVWS